MAERITGIRIGLQHLMAMWQREGLTTSAFSPLSDARLAGPAGAAGIPEPAPPPGDDALLAELREALAVLAAPDMKFALRMGGGSAPMQAQTLCFAKGKPPAGFLLAGNEAVVFRYEDENAVLDGLVGLHASRVQTPAANLVPPLTDPEAFVCLLHAIDMYRRSYYVSLLACAPQTRAGVALVSFQRDMERVLKARDVRWLLGAFVALMPNLPLGENRADPVRAVADAGLCRIMQDKDGKPWLVFTDEGRALGVEFERTWMTGIGYGLHALVAGQSVQVGYGFVAPTALANHVVTVVEEQGALRMNHQAFMADQLKALWAGLLDEGWRQVASGVAKAAPVAQPRPRRAAAAGGAQAQATPAAKPTPTATPTPVGMPTPATKLSPVAKPASPAAPAPQARAAFCMHCGKPLTAEDRFCNSCGKPVT